MESTDLEDFTKALADIERRNGARLFYRLFPGEDTVQPGGSVTPPPKTDGSEDWNDPFRWRDESKSIRVAVMPESLELRQVFGAAYVTRPLLDDDRLDPELDDV